MCLPYALDDQTRAKVLHIKETTCLGHDEGKEHLPPLSILCEVLLVPERYGNYEFVQTVLKQIHIKCKIYIVNNVIMKDEHLMYTCTNTCTNTSTNTCTNTCTNTY